MRKKVLTPIVPVFAMDRFSMDATMLPMAVRMPTYTEDRWSMPAAGTTLSAMLPVKPAAMLDPR